MITAVFVLARTLHIGCAMMLVALPYFMRIVAEPVLADKGENDQSFVQIVGRWWWSALILEALSGIVWFWLVAAQMSGQSSWGPIAGSDLNIVLWQTQFGQLWLGRLGIGIALTVILSLAARQRITVDAKASGASWLVLILSSALLITLAWAGHAGAGIHEHVFHLGTDILHLLIGVVWPMGLIPLGLFLWYSGSRNLVFPEDAEIKILTRFSRGSLIAVLLLVITGFINGWLMVGSWGALITTIYGELLLAKVSVVLIMIGLGAWNRLYLLPRLPEGTVTFKYLRKTILAESCLALVVLFIVGAMGMTSPPSQ